MALSYLEVCKHLGTPTLEAVLRTARLKFLQSMTRDPEAHQLFWCCALGKYEFEPQAQTNPWSEQYFTDIIELEPLDGVQYLVQCVSENWKKYRAKPLDSCWLMKSVRGSSSI